MEFYSFEPLNDIVDLTNLLYNLKFKYIEARGAIHPRSYKIYVNTVNYCDFTYMPKNIYDNMFLNSCKPSITKQLFGFFIVQLKYTAFQFVRLNSFCYQHKDNQLHKPLKT
jgi:hypothetical protein